jgi:hypothetical protein
MSADNLLSNCHWPPLAEPYHTALHEAVGMILDHCDVVGIIASGTIIRGDPGPSSDLDLYVIHADSWRQRIQKWFNGVPAEIFINPVHQIARYFEAERHAARPLTAHMLATGVVILARDPVIDVLRERAETLLKTTPDPGADDLRWQRYILALQYEDACDIAADSPSALMILSVAVHGMLHYRFLQANRFIPRDKDLLTALHDLDPELAEIARAFYTESDPAARLVLAAQIADRTIQARGFFEWESEPEDV